ncbi:MAG TPA: hypothetical protein V6D00_13055 [Pantanalinema sp.]
MTTPLQWAINVNPSRLSPDFSLDELHRSGDRAVEHLSDLGASYVRMDLLWAHLEPEPGRVRLEVVAWYRHYLKALVQSGRSIYAILYNPPAWACELADRDLDGFLVAWRQYCRLCAREFGDLVGIWQVWNEPNNFVSHLKDDFNLFEVKTFSLASWRVTLPVGVRWQALVPLFRIARQELGEDAFLIYNVISNVSEYTPVSYPGWTEWEHFTDQFMEQAGDCVDAIALDHYPDTWVPGSGPLHWDPIDVLARKVNDPRSTWYGKTALVGEFGYSSCPNVDLIKRPVRVRFFPEDHSPETMRDWYAQALPHLAERLAPERWPHNKLNLANVYELYDAVPGHLMDGSHAEVIGIENHFGLIDVTGALKPAYHVLKDMIHGRLLAAEPLKRRTPTHPLRLYMQGSAASRMVHRRLAPMVYALYQAVRPPLRRHDAGVLSAGAIWALYQLWRAATRPSK